ncbi:MAG: glycosyltransferase family 4 protein [Patescibacteria group bacterium]|jgi:glycosyltransferase involved in cell wall biosynthesis
MKVLLITTKASIGGAQMFVLNLARSLKERGVEVVVGAGDGDWLAGELESSGISFYRFKSLKRDSSLWSGWRFISELRRFLKQHDFDVVHFNSSNALFGVLALARLKPKPMSVFTVHGLSVLDRNYPAKFWKRRIYRLFFRYLLPLVDKVVFVSQLNLEEARRDGLIKGGAFIYNGLAEKNLNFLSKLEARDWLTNKAGRNLKNEYLVGSIGRLSYQKNFSWLIAVWPEILKIKPEARLVVLGSGEEEKNLRALIDSLGLSDKVFIIFSDQASRYLKAFDLFVLPSRYEGLPLTLIEALLARLPVLASRVGGNEEILGREEELYALDDQKEFLARLERMAADPDLAAKLLLVNQESAARFSLDEMVAKYLKIYSNQLK